MDKFRIRIRWSVNNWVVLEQEMDAQINSQYVWAVPPKIFETHLHPTPEQNWAQCEIHLIPAKEEK